MKKTAIIITLFFAFLLIIEMGFVFGSMLSIFISLLVYLVYARISHILTVNEFSKKYEDIYVVSCNPNTGEELALPNDIVDLVVFVPYEEVINEVNNQKDLLLESSNTFYCDPKLTEEQKIKVIPIIFKDGKNVNEKWKNQFKKRVIIEIEESRANRHEMLKQADPNWYHKNSNSQNGVVWQK